MRTTQKRNFLRSTNAGFAHGRLHSTKATAPKIGAGKRWTWLEEGRRYRFILLLLILERQSEKEDRVRDELGFDVVFLLLIAQELAYAVQDFAIF